MDTATEAETGVGQDHQLRLPGLGAAGYGWSLAPGQEGLPVTVRQAPAPPPSTPPPPGASADVVFLVSASKPGEYQLRFEQRRPWERGGPAQQTHTLTLHVHE
ncbi:MAG TPA: protease inhibitor I42 family protein [Streptosporangiaceae bacterium]|nr:protease inhibitor I42 family protein [Streptosporangiaceae bacterium]